MKNKKIKVVVPAPQVNMGGHLLEQPLPVDGIDMLDPFLLIHHWKNTFPGNQRENDLGVGPHPHRGFSPVTFVFKGQVEHRDSLGNRAIVEEGGTQWMFAGKGLTHSERMGKEIAENGGEVEFIQFWVNAPRSVKMEKPFYKPITKEQTPIVKADGVEIGVVSGELDGVKGVAPTYSPQLLLRGEIQEGAEYSIEVPEGFQSLLYLLDGGMEVDGEALKGKDMAVFEDIGSTISIKGTEQTRFIVLAGEPLNEPVMSYGPFVMSTETEIMQALRDSQMGKMGILIEEFE